MTVATEKLALIRAIQRTQGFGLFFVVCECTQLVEALLWIQQALPDSGVSTLELDGSEQDRRLVNEIEAVMYELPQTDVLLISRFENWLDLSPSASPNHPALNHLNQQREWFRDQLGIRLVFVLPPHGVTLMIQQAPDFFDWRSGLFHFAACP